MAFLDGDNQKNYSPPSFYGQNICIVDRMAELLAFSNRIAIIPLYLKLLFLDGKRLFANHLVTLKNYKNYLKS